MVYTNSTNAHLLSDHPWLENVFYAQMAWKSTLIWFWKGGIFNFGREDLLFNVI